MGNGAPFRCLGSAASPSYRGRSDARLGSLSAVRVHQLGTAFRRPWPRRGACDLASPHVVGRLPVPFPCISTDRRPFHGRRSGAGRDGGRAAVSRGPPAAPVSAALATDGAPLSGVGQQPYIQLRLGCFLLLSIRISRLPLFTPAAFVRPKARHSNPKPLGPEASIPAASHAIPSHPIPSIRSACAPAIAQSSK